MHFSIPGHDPFDIETLILDLNGTISIDGKLIRGVKKRIEELRTLLRVVLFTGDTQGTGRQIADVLGIEIRLTKNASEKAKEAESLNPETTATIGNGAIDLELFRTVKLPICVIEAEGAYTETLRASIVVHRSIIAALDFLLKHNRAIATMRNSTTLR